MRRIALLLLVGCNPVNNVSVSFGDQGEGLDGFLCKANGNYVLNRVPADVDGGTSGAASLVTDFVNLSGVPGCRTSQLVEWCRTHTCAAVPGTRKCTPITLPTGLDAGTNRDEVRATVKADFASLSGDSISSHAPDEFVMLRVIATTQSCASLGEADFDKTALVGCAYSCPVLFSKVDQDVYLGFDTLSGQCEQGLRTCSDNELHWQP